MGLCHLKQSWRSVLPRPEELPLHRVSPAHAKLLPYHLSSKSPYQAGDKDLAYRSWAAVQGEPSAPSPALLQLRGTAQHTASEVPNSSTPGSHVHIGSATAHFIRKWCLIGNNTCNREGPWKITDFALYYYFHYRRCHVYFSYGADHTGPFGTLINVLSVLIGKCNNYQKTSACGITGSEMFPYNIYWATFWHSRL